MSFISRITFARGEMFFLHIEAWDPDPLGDPEPDMDRIRWIKWYRIKQNPDGSWPAWNWNTPIRTVFWPPDSNGDDRYESWISQCFSEDGVYRYCAKADDKPGRDDDDIGGPSPEKEIKICGVDYVIVVPNPAYVAVGSQVVLNAKAYNNGPDDERHFDDSGDPIDGTADDDIHVNGLFEWTQDNPLLGILGIPNNSSISFTAGFASGTCTVEAEHIESGIIGSTTVVVVKVESITVLSGAIHEEGKNWAISKRDGEVFIEATMSPNTDEAASVVTWEGGLPVEGHPRQRSVTQTVPARTTVRATAGSSSANLDVWVLWATLTVRSSGNKSAGNDTSFPDGWGGDSLGEMTDEDDQIEIGEAIGKVEIVVTLLPPGVHDIVKTNWDIRRWVRFKEFENGWLVYGDSRDDTSGHDFKDLVPDNDDRIYDLDGPTCGIAFMVNHTIEVYNSYEQWVEWRGAVCSALVYWHYRARIDDDLDEGNKPFNDDTELNDVGSGAINIPDSAYYSPR